MRKCKECKIEYSEKGSVFCKECNDNKYLFVRQETDKKKKVEECEKLIKEYKTAQNKEEV